LACAAAISKLTVACDGREFVQRLLVCRIFGLKPAHGVPSIWLMEDLRIARDGPFERVHDRPCWNVVAFIYIIFDRCVRNAFKVLV
jgi:hypothetical protein